MATNSHSGNEVTYSEHDILLSTTDLDSRITYSNDKFCEIAGYSLDEMRGKPHNLVRHRDMPKAAFANMWQTLKSGESWMGPVKNRCKNGDYYWVNAFVTPIRNSQGAVVEYQSVRTKPRRDVVERASSEYEKLNNGSKAKCTKPTVNITSFILAGMVAIWFVEFFDIVFGGVSIVNTFGLVATTVMSAMFYQWRKRYLKVVEKAKKIYGNPLMVYMYSGQCDALGFIDLAIDMQQAKLKAVVGRVNDATKHVYANAQATSDSGDTVASLLEQQSGEVSQIATAMDQFSSTIQELANTVNQAAEASDTLEQHTVSGKGSVDSTIADIQRLDVQLQSAAKELKTLVEGNSLIQNILDEINAIAEQTNLLALNAAIEAARAGEQGRGFAVVADEVRSLAARTQQSTEEITKRIDTLKQASERAQSAMEQGVELSTQSVKSANDSGESLNVIQEQVSVIADLNRSIATAIEEQSVVAEQVSRNVNLVKELSDTSGEHGKESKARNESLRYEVDQQSSLVAQFA
ncbi:methyl-accepting chemotaxis protein [Aestuariibacter halophilus]|uniref:Methyl-accepting chemotaxis protein n=1 Tax=Fluctibacter halophilus TaxID=226011 RepID=A0ABS8GE14_9ALTE|nr:PAS domain-containing methyl-accepting chemotaxis protein [Aestuariibacter halophilus]MCC2618351.1 methyl-accepting chemotaxis protein [Aestuariibacter halophilus]